jgi:hypothetical protein
MILAPMSSRLWIAVRLRFNGDRALPRHIPKVQTLFDFDLQAQMGVKFFVSLRNSSSAPE